MVSKQLLIFLYNLFSFRKQIFVITFENGCVFVNDIEIISKRAKNRYHVFITLFDQYITDIKTTKNSENYKYLSIHEISDLLNKAGFPISDLEKQIRLPIYEIMKKVPNLIEFKRWSGIHEKNFGYRLNAKYIRIGL